VPFVQEIERDLELSQLQASVARTEPRFRLAAVVAEFAEILRQSYWAKGSAIADLVPMARQVARELPDDPTVAELVRLIEKSQRLEETMSPAERTDRDRLAQDQAPVFPHFPPSGTWR
jgi:Ca-activated chloride channel family protein